MSKQALQIDIVSDVVCPWCIVGYKSLEQALADAGEAFYVELRWHPFELNPEMPAEGQNLGEHIAQKYGSDEQARQAASKRLTEMGAALGFEFNYSEESRMRNTFKSHQLLHWARDSGKQTELKLALFKAYFTDQQNIDDANVLLEAVQHAGLDPEEASAVLTDGRFEEAVKREEAHWLDRGIQAVPAFVFNNQYMVPGAQDVTVFADVLAKFQEQPTAATPN